MKKIILTLAFLAFIVGINEIKSQINNQGKLYVQQGKFAEAVQEFEKILPQMEQENATRYPETLFLTALSYSQLNNYQKAEENFRKCVNYCEQVQRTNTDYYIHSLSKLGSVLNGQKKYKDAETVLLKAKTKVEQQPKGTETPVYTEICIGLSNSYKATNNFSEAASYYKKLVDIHKKASGENSKEYMIAATNLGEFYYSIGQKENAIRVFSGIPKNTQFPEYAVVCNDLGVLYTQIGRYDDAEALFIQAKEITASLLGTDKPEYTHSCNQLAWFYNTTKKFDKSLENLEENNKVTKEQVGESHTDYAQSCLKLAEGYIGAKLYDKPIEDLLIKAKDIYKNADKQFMKSYILTCLDLGIFYTEMAIQKAADSKEQYIDKSRDYYSAAKNSLLEAKQLHKSINDTSSQMYVSNLNRFLTLYGVKQEYGQMVDIYIEIMNLIKSKTGTDNVNYARNSYNLAVVYINQGMYDKAEPLLNGAKQVGEMKFKQNPLYADICDALAIVYDRTFNNYKQVELYEEIKRRQETSLPSNHPNYIRTCVKLANAYTKTGKYYQAETLYLKAIKVQQSESDNTAYFESLKLLAKLYIKTKEYPRAVKLFKEILASIGEDNLDYVDICIDMAYINNKLGNYDMVENYYSKALKVLDSDKMQTNSRAATIYNNLGVYYTNIGNYEKAEKLLLKSRKINANVFGKQSSEYATACSNVADIYSRLGKKEAMPLYEEVLRIYESTIGKFNDKYASALNNVSLLYHKNGNLPKAVSFSKEAKDISEQRYGKKSEAYISTCANLAGLYDEWEKNDLAEKLYVEADSINRQIRNKKHPDYAFIPHSLACFYDKIGQYDKAEPLYIQTNEIFVSLLQQSEKYMSEKERENYISRKINGFFNNNYSFFINRQKDKDTLIGIVYNNALNVKEQLLKSSVSLRKAVLQGNDSNLVRKYDKMIEYRKILSQQYSLPIDKHTENIQELEEKVNSLEKELLRATNSTPKADNQIGWQAIRDTLQDDEAAIEFIQYDYHDGKKLTGEVFYYALVLRKNYKFPKAVFVCEQQKILGLLKRPADIAEYEYITELYDVKSEKAAALYKFAWQALESYLDGVSSIYMAPTGLLNKISYDAIPYKNRDLLSDKYKITYLTSTSKILNKTSLYTEDVEDVAMFGGIEYDMSIEEMQELSDNFKKGNTEYESNNFDDELLESGKWSYLPGSLKEVEAIQTKLAKKNIKVSLFKGKKGSEEQFKAMEKNAPAVLHVATHGFYFGFDTKSETQKQELSEDVEFAYSDNPMLRSGFILAGANNAFEGVRIPRGVEDGVLTASEISNLNFFKTKLVVLSACQTGQGDVKGNEGVYGLQRSFKMAGTNFLLFSLWEIPDEPTKELMSIFYDNWFSGLEIREAFRKAQNKLKSKYKKVKGAAYAWAAFVLVE